MSGPNRPKRPSARPTSRPDMAVAAEAARVRGAQSAGESAPEEPALEVAVAAPSSPTAESATPASPMPASAAPRPPRVSARRSSPNLGGPDPHVKAPAAPADRPTRAVEPRVEPARAKPSVHTAKTVVPTLDKSGENARKAATKGARPAAKKARPTGAEATNGAPAADARALTGTEAASSAEASRKPAVKEDAAPTRRPSRPRVDQDHREPALTPGVLPVEAADTWNAEAAAPADLNPFDPADPQQGLTRETIAARMLRAPTPDAQHLDAERSAAHSILASDYYDRQYGTHGLRSLAADVDEFGFDPYVEERARKPLDLLVQRYFRVQFDGAARVPSEGRALFVANRAGALPWDALVLRTMLRNHRPDLPALRWLAEDDVIHYPFLGVFMNRLGAVRACPENAERLLTRDRLVAVFPEGAQGSRKSFQERYRLQRFGRGGYIRLALKLGVPIFPTAIVGSEDVQPLLGRSRLLGRLFGTESLPLTPTFPWLGALGLVPAPVKWRVVIGEPVDLSSYGPKAADDALVVHRLNEQVRNILQGLVDSARSQRGHALFG